MAEYKFPKVLDLKYLKAHQLLSLRLQYEFAETYLKTGDAVVYAMAWEIRENVDPLSTKKLTGRSLMNPFMQCIIIV